MPKYLRQAGIWIRMRDVARDPATGLPQQTGALPWRARGKPHEVLLVTGRTSKRWSIPKGWPMFGKSLADAAAQEAFEEAGIRGIVGQEPIGRFDHTKTHGLVGTIDVTIIVHPLEVEKVLKDWPEHAERERRWLAPTEAAELVDNDALKTILLDFRPECGA